MFGQGHHDALLKEVEQLRERIRELEAEHARGLRLDSVTGLLSPRALRGRLAEECERARRYQRPLCVAVLAVDDFEALELSHGFKAGDELVIAVARRLRGSTRSTDLVGRTGGAEFTLLLPDTDAATAVPGLERLLVELELTGEGTIRAAGASMGIAALQRGMSAEGLLASARQALGHSRATGGGRATVAAEADAILDPATAPQREAIEALAVALLERDRYTGEHSEAVISMSAAVARTLGCNAVEVERVRSAALLHDIGKVAIPDEILHKAGPLNDDEWMLMRQHPVIGERILRVLPGLGAVARMVRHEHAVEELMRCAGTQFDPDVTAALIGHLYGRRQGGVVSA